MKSRIYNINIRLVTPEEYFITENLAREAFWGCMDHSTCDGEHLLVHKLRKHPAYVPELDYVAEVEGKIVGHVMYSLMKVVTPDGRTIPVLTFGPLSVSPKYKMSGVGSALMHTTIAEAARMGYRAIILYGHADYYPRFGFRRASSYGITAENGASFDSLMAMELYDGALDGISGCYIEEKVFRIDPVELAEFEKSFPHKEPVKLLPVTVLTEKMPPVVKAAFEQHRVKYVSQLQKYSGVEMLGWAGMSEEILVEMNHLLIQLGYTRKLLPSSYILQLTEMRVRNPICKLIRTKAGISLYRVESEGQKMILKVFEKLEDRREIDNYKMLRAIGVPTLSLLGYTQNSILLPDVDESDEYCLGKEDDLSDVQVAKAVAKWYRELHEKGRLYLKATKASMYDESDVITLDNMRIIAEKTDTTDNELWKMIHDNFSIIRKKIDALPKTLTYNDFYWTNLIVGKDKQRAFMFDYNLLGKGIAYGDIRNVTGSLSEEAAEAFRKEYGVENMEAQAVADAFISPVVTLFFGCETNDFPEWAEESLAELHNGSIVKNLCKWLEMK